MAGSQSLLVLAICMENGPAGKCNEPRRASDTRKLTTGVRIPTGNTNPPAEWYQSDHFKFFGSIIHCRVVSSATCNSACNRASSTWSAAFAFVAAGTCFERFNNRVSSAFASCSKRLFSRSISPVASAVLPKLSTIRQPA